MIARRAIQIFRTVGNVVQSRVRLQQQQQQQPPPPPPQNTFNVRIATTTTRSGAILPEPKRTRFGFLSVICAVIVGNFIGAMMSKTGAAFLEEKQLFVPSDDDDDDDDEDDDDDD